MSKLFIVHNGKQEYLKYCIEIAEKYKNETYLIGNEKKYVRLSDKYISDEMDLPLFEEFCKYYIHMSPSPKEFEMLCFKRYFQLLKVVEENKNIKSLWLMDSDVLLFDDLQKFENELINEKYSSALWTPEQERYDWLTSAGLSFWTNESLRSFVEFLIFTYKFNIEKLEEKWFYHKNENKSGGICDMTLLYLWVSENREKNYNLYNAYLDYGFIDDNNISLSKNINLGKEKNNINIQTLPFINIKRVNFENGKYYFLDQHNSKYPIRSIHFQGKYKVYMEFYGREKNVNLFILFKPVIILIINKLKNKVKIRNKIKIIKNFFKG